MRGITDVGRVCGVFPIDRLLRSARNVFDDGLGAVRVGLTAKGDRGTDRGAVTELPRGTPVCDGRSVRLADNGARRVAEIGVERLADIGDRAALGRGATPMGGRTVRVGALARPIVFVSRGTLRTRALDARGADKPLDRVPLRVGDGRATERRGVLADARPTDRVGPDLDTPREAVAPRAAPRDALRRFPAPSASDCGAARKAKAVIIPRPIRVARCTFIANLRCSVRPFLGSSAMWSDKATIAWIVSSC